jgi:hypothetical protein
MLMIQPVPFRRALLAWRRRWPMRCRRWRPGGSALSARGVLTLAWILHGAQLAWCS